MAVNLSPVYGVAGQLFNDNGDPLAGGKIYTYLAGTTTNAATYTNATGSIAHSNPIVLDGAGRVPSGEIWLTDGISYKFVVEDSVNNLIGTYDNLQGINSNFVAFTNEQEIQTATAGQTVFTLTTTQYQPGTNSLSVFVDGVNQYGPGAQYAYVETDNTTVTFTNGLHVGAEVKFTTSQLNSSGSTDASLVTYDPPFTASVSTNVEAKLAQQISILDFGADPTGVADSKTAIEAAVTEAAGKSLLLPPGNYKIASNLTISNCDIFAQGGVLVPNAGVTITINATMFAPLVRIFNLAAAGSVIDGKMNCDTLHPEWWGAIADGRADIQTGTDNTIFIQAALDYAAALVPYTAGGSQAVVLCGSYKVTSTIDVPAGVTFKGTSPWLSEIWAPTGFNSIIVETTGSGPPAQVSDMLIQCYGGSGTSGQALKLSANGSRAFNLWIGGINGSGINLASTDQILDRFVIDESSGAGVGVRISSPVVQVSNGTIYRQLVGLIVELTDGTEYGTVQLTNIKVENGWNNANGVGYYFRDSTGTYSRRIFGTNLVAISINATPFQNGAFRFEGAADVCLTNCHARIDGGPSATTNQYGFVADSNSSGLKFIGCSAEGFRIGFITYTSAYFDGCEAITCQTGFYTNSDGVAYNACRANDNTINGFWMDQPTGVLATSYVGCNANANVTNFRLDNTNAISASYVGCTAKNGSTANYTITGVFTTAGNI